MPALLELQGAWRRVLQDRHGPARAAEADITDWVVGGAEAARAALEVYRGTCTGTLTHALRLTYPIVQRLVGEEFFEALVPLFVQVEWPDSADLEAYGRGFPDFLQGFAPAASLPYLPDVARLEWAVSRALHAPEMPPIAPAQLAGLAGEALAQLRLAPQPGFSLLQLAHPADAIWRAVLAQDEAAMSVALAGGPVRLQVERAGSDVRLTRLTHDEWRLAAALCASQPLAQAVEDQDPTDVERWLGEHLAAGRFYDPNIYRRKTA